MYLIWRDCGFTLFCIPCHFAPPAPTWSQLVSTTRSPESGKEPCRVWGRCHTWSMNGVDIQWRKSQRVATSERTNHKTKKLMKKKLKLKGWRDLFLSFSSEWFKTLRCELNGAKGFRCHLQESPPAERGDEDLGISSDMDADDGFPADFRRENEIYLQ